MKGFASLAELARLEGQVIGVSDWIVVDQQRIDRFAQATGDAQWIHVDPLRAAGGPFGGTVAHGFLTLALLPEMFASAIAIADVRMGLNYGLDRVRFPAPVPAGARLRAEFRLLAFEAVAGGAQLRTEATMACADAAKPACVAQWLTQHFV